MLECVAPHHIWTFVAVVAAACCGCVYCYSLKSSKILVGRCWPGILCAWRPGPRQYHCHCGCGDGRYSCSFSCLLMLCCRLLRFSSSRLQFFQGFPSSRGFTDTFRDVYALPLHQLELPKVCIEEGCFLIQTLGMLPCRVGLHEAPFRIYAGPSGGHVRPKH